MKTMTLIRKDREAILNKVDHLVQRKHFDPSLNGANWRELVEDWRPRILAADTVEGLETQISALLSRLKTSHTGFFHQSLRTIPARHAINATCRPYASNGCSAKWMFQDVHDGGAAYKAGIRAGDLLLELNGKEVSPPSQPVFRMGCTARLTIERLSGDRAEVEISVPAPKSRKHPVNQPLAIVCSTLQPGLGLLKVTMFPGAIGIDLAHGFDRAIAALRECDRLIVDLRGNTGGGIGGLRLMSYLTPDKRPVGYSLTKKRAASGYRREDLSQFGRIPSHKATLLWLLIRYAFVDKSITVVTEGLGQQRFHGRIVILVNEHSASAAEMLAAFARENNLAKIVGTKTPGRLLSGSAFKVGHGFLLGLPVGAYLTWQGTLLEGKGVEPDEALDLSRDALNEGRDTQLEKAIEVVTAL